MGRIENYPKRTRHFEMPSQEGEFDQEYILNQIKIAAERTPSKYQTGEPCAKPGTVNDQFASEVYKYMMDNCNPNNIDGHMFLGSYELEKEAIAMTAKLLGLKSEDGYSGFFLGGGTESANQALWTYRNKYYAEKGIDIRKGGLEAITRIKKSPKIIAPMDAHFSLLKGVDLLGIGTQNVVFYGLNEDYSANLTDLASKVQREYEEGGEFLLNWIVAGDTVKGKVHDAEKICGIISDLSSRYKKQRPPAVVDAAGQYLFLSTMRDSTQYPKRIPNWDFRVPDISAVICDPHKNEIPYNAGIILFRNFADTTFTNISTGYLSLDMLQKAGLSDEEMKLSQILSTIPTSRGGYGPAATWAYYMKYGIEGIRKKKEKIWRVTNRFKELLRHSKNYDLVCEPETANIVFRLKNSFPIQSNKTIYERVNNSGDNNFYIGHDDSALARTPEEQNDNTGRFYGLYANIMNHNSEEAIERLVAYLETEADKLRKE